VVPDPAGRVYLNVGHTGLDTPDLQQWIERLGLRAVFLVHDLIPLTHPEFCRPHSVAQHRIKMETMLRCASGVISNSAATLDDLARFAAAEDLAVPPSHVAWIAGHDIPRAVEPAHFDRPYFLAVGTIEGRKNHILLLQLWKRLAERLGEKTPLLVIAGQRGWEAEHALAMLDRTPALKGHVIERNRANDAEMVELLAGAEALLMPSFVEGFGIPVVEALQMGTPVIASDLPVFREIAGEIPRYLDSFDGIAWERAVEEFLSLGLERERQRSLLAGWTPPSWESHFATVEPWLSTLASASSHVDGSARVS
jgi:glycosyltransferase involved in cell wall biosynthesis